MLGGNKGSLSGLGRVGELSRRMSGQSEGRALYKRELWAQEAEGGRLSSLRGPQSLPRAYLVASSLERTRLVLTKPRNVR